MKQKTVRFSRQEKLRFLAFVVLLELMIIIFIACANTFGTTAFVLFYNLGYGLLISTIVPLIYIYRKSLPLSELGMKKFGAKQALVALAFIAFSIGGQSIPLITEGAQLQWDLLIVGFLPLVMTTFFEEFLFRGFMQTQIEKRFGVAPALLVSSLAFSLYHLGYPGYRNIEDIALLAVVGLGFALAYKLSGNNLLVAYLVNLPNALLTYMLHSSQFPTFNNGAIIASAITIVCVAIVFFVYRRKFSVVRHTRKKL